MSKILVVEDEININELISYNLKENGYQVLSAEDGIKGLDLALKESPDLILLDVMLPGKNGMDICRELREVHHKTMPIIMLTAKSEEIDKVLGLEFGADDYVTKPFSVRELLARVRAVLRRVENMQEERKGNKPDIKSIVVDDLIIDIDKHEVWFKDQSIELTFKEFELLRTLAQNRGKVITREYLLDTVWGFDYIGETRTVDVHVRYLRRKLGDASDYIQTVRGVGYKVH
jgi:two-component system alkaline phosphatase synthesis response regulator PhoP